MVNRPHIKRRIGSSIHYKMNDNIDIALSHLGRNNKTEAISILNRTLVHMEYNYNDLEGQEIADFVQFAITVGVSFATIQEFYEAINSEYVPTSQELWGLKKESPYQIE